MACRFQCWKNSIGLIDQSNGTGAINVKMDGPVLEEKYSFKILKLSFFF